MYSLRYSSTPSGRVMELRDKTLARDTTSSPYCDIITRNSAYFKRSAWAVYQYIFNTKLIEKYENKNCGFAT